MITFLKEHSYLCVKVAWWKKLLCINSHHVANLKFIFLSLCVYLFKNCPSQFLSQLELAESVFCSHKELSCLSCKNKNKSLTLSYFVGKFKFAVCWDHIPNGLFHWATFTSFSRNDFKNLSNQYKYRTNKSWKYRFIKIRMFLQKLFFSIVHTIWQVACKCRDYESAFM